MSKATADWKRVGDRFYRSTRLYTGVFDPNLELENYVVVGAVYGGAVGMLPTTRQTSDTVLSTCC
jgi:hypothetical protein